jgi:hypothetical protein
LYHKPNPFSLGFPYANLKVFPLPFFPLLNVFAVGGAIATAGISFGLYFKRSSHLDINLEPVKFFRYLIFQFGGSLRDENLDTRLPVAVSNAHPDDTREAHELILTVPPLLSF